MDYNVFLQSKQHRVFPCGKDIKETDLHPSLFRFQKILCLWAIKQGRAAIFSSTGTGKTRMQLEFARFMGKNVLIVSPLAVAEQTIAEAKKMDMEVRFCAEPTGEEGIWITNYQKLHKFSGAPYDVIILEDSSIIKNVDGATKKLLIENFTHIPFRLCCTATPSPNDIAELANHSEFLGIMKRQEMLASFFVHDSAKSANVGGWRLKGHAEEAFWKWCSTWSMYMRMPEDVNCDNNGFILPPLNISTEIVEATFIPPGEMFPRLVQGIKGRSQARKTSLMDRVERAAEIINESSEQWLVWCWLNDEGRELHKRLNDSVLIEGATPDEKRVEYAFQWQRGEKRTLITKVSQFGQGLNWQHCHNILYLGISDSWEQWHQSIRRCWRFGQKHPVNVIVVTSKAEMTVVDNVRRKEKENEKLAAAVIAINKEVQLEELIGNNHQLEYHPTKEIILPSWLQSCKR